MKVIKVSLYLRSSFGFKILPFFAFDTAIPPFSLGFKAKSRKTNSTVLEEDGNAVSEAMVSLNTFRRFPS